jgi:hypothetical protein
MALTTALASLTSTGTALEQFVAPKPGPVSSQRAPRASVRRASLAVRREQPFGSNQFEKRNLKKLPDRSRGGPRVNGNKSRGVPLPALEVSGSGPGFRKFWSSPASTWRTRGDAWRLPRRSGAQGGLPRPLCALSAVIPVPCPLRGQDLCGLAAVQLRENRCAAIDVTYSVPGDVSAKAVSR